MAKKATSTRKATTSSFTISFQAPGSVPEKVKVKTGSTVADLTEQLNLEGYTVSVNGVTANSSTVLTKDAVVRVGIKTKNA